MRKANLNAEGNRIKALLDLLSSLLSHWRAFKEIYLKTVANKNLWRNSQVANSSWPVSGVFASLWIPVALWKPSAIQGCHINYKPLTENIARHADVVFQQKGRLEAAVTTPNPFYASAPVREIRLLFFLNATMRSHNGYQCSWVTLITTCLQQDCAGDGDRQA